MVDLLGVEGGSGRRGGASVAWAACGIALWPGGVKAPCGIGPTLRQLMQGECIQRPARERAVEQRMATARAKGKSILVGCAGWSIPRQHAHLFGAGGHHDPRYWRWHGSPRMYYSDYEEPALRELATAVRARAPAGTRRLVVFDNTAHGFAAANAARLQEILARPAGKSRR